MNFELLLLREGGQDLRTECCNRLIFHVRSQNTGFSLCNRHAILYAVCGHARVDARMCIFAVAAFAVNVILQTHPYNYEANWNGPEKRVVWNSSGGGGTSCRYGVVFISGSRCFCPWLRDAKFFGRCSQPKRILPYVAFLCNFACGVALCPG